MKKKTRLKILGMYSIVSSAVKILAIISSSLSTVVSKMRFLRWPQRRGTGDNFGNQETLRKHELCLKLPHLTPHTASFQRVLIYASYISNNADYFIRSMSVQ